MKRHILIFCFIIFPLLISAQIIDLSVWNNIRNSAYTIDDSIHIRCETIELPGIETELFHFTGDQWESTQMELVEGLTYEGIIPALYGGAQTCRFRTVADTLVGMMPALILDDIFPPAIDVISFVADDSLGDNLVQQSPHLDITGNYFGYSDTRFYSGITNDGGNFPINSGGIFPSTYYFYITTIINPENVLLDSVGYAMVYGNVPLFLSEGLYRINGTELNLQSLQQIGNLESEVVDDMLITACDLQTLVNDEFFGDWPSLTNSLIVEMITISFSLPDQLILADLSKFSLQFIDQYVIEPFANILPEISECTANDNGISTEVSCIYFDENGNFPLIAEVEIDSEIFELLPLGFDYSVPVSFYADIPLTGWPDATFRFSDNGYEFVEEVVQSGTDAGNDLPTTDFNLTNHPNPFNPSTTISFHLNTEITENTELMIYNLKGQKVKTLDCHPEFIEGSVQSNKTPRPSTTLRMTRKETVQSTLWMTQAGSNYSVIWNGTDDNYQPVSSGIYFAILKAGNQQQTRKMLLMK